MTCIAVIPARGGSRRIPRKNIKMFHGKPIIAYSIEAARESGLFDRIIVTTDDMEISGIAISYGAETIGRPDHLAKNEAGTQEVFRWSVAGFDYNYVCCVYPTAPLMSVVDLQRGLFELMANKDSHYSFSVGTEPLQDAGQFYWAYKPALMRGEPLISTRTIMIPISTDRVCDINTIQDFERAEQMYSALQEKK